MHTALRVGRSPMKWILANGRAPPVLPISEKPLSNVEGLNDVRTLLADFFSILLGIDQIVLEGAYRDGRWHSGLDGSNRIVLQEELGL